jgi:uncharacterized protein YprB with RNaseH-like and TPR domain
MQADELKRRLSVLRRGEAPPVEARAQTPRRPACDLHECFPEGACCDTERGEVFVCSLPLTDITPEAERLNARFRDVFAQAARLAAEDALPRPLAPLAAIEPDAVMLIDTETAGFHGRPLFLVGLLRWRDGGLVLSQYFARDYAREAALLAQLRAVLPEIELLVSFNGKSFDWPFVRDRMTYHRLPCEAAFAHLDLLHPSRRRWGGRLPNCRLQTLERYLCGRWRRGDVAGAEIPQRYHDYVREQDARLIAPIFHHNRLDLITLAEVLAALTRADPPEAPAGA